MSQEHIGKEKYDIALKTIELQQKDIERLKKYLEIKDNQERIKTIEAIATKAPGMHLFFLNFIEEAKPEPAVTPSDFAKLKAEKEKLAKKNEQFRNEINAVSGKYLGLQRKLESYNEEYKGVKLQINDLETANEILREELAKKDKEVEIMIEYLKQAQPMKVKEQPKEVAKDLPHFGGKENAKCEDPQKTKKLFANSNVFH